MKQVESTVYDKDFFKRVYGTDNQSFDFSSGVSKDYYKEMVDLVKLRKSDTVVDYGCGNGNLSFLLWKKYHCKIIAFDYSKDAIEICNARLKQFKKKYPKININFFVANNTNLPQLSGIRVVYFCDVVEHMYNSEIKLAISKIKSWSQRKIIMVIHTDNNYYLRLVRPIIYLFMILLGKKTVSQAISDKQEEARVHINLTNPNVLAKTFKRLEVMHIKTKYPKVTKSKIKKQLSDFGAINTIVSLCYFALNLIPFLSPSFYSVFWLNGIGHKKVTVSGIKIAKKIR
jgi:2-polyprenyl-3-methyl-5-hydroxy-6-metoxy-1,4-benzoquinol methylase